MAQALGASAAWDWRDDAACLNEDWDIFFPSTCLKNSRLYDRARAICARCPVIAECDAFADSLPQKQREFGMWAGKSPEERRTSRFRSGPKATPQRTGDS